MIREQRSCRGNPFGSGNRTFVPTPGHAGAVARLLRAVGAGEGRVTLAAPAGMGKTVTLLEALERLRNPQRRLARVAGHVDSASMLQDLARRLGMAISPRGDRHEAWRALQDAARLCRIQGQALVLAIDDAHLLTRSEDRADLERLASLDLHPGRLVTTILVGRPPEDAADRPAPSPWDLTIRLHALTRREAADYLQLRLKNAGYGETLLTARAMTSLHGLSRGIPQALDRLAGLALATATSRRLDVVDPELVEEIAWESIDDREPVLP